MAKKNDVFDEIETYRANNLKYEEFHGKADSTYILEFSKPLIEAGFTHDQIVTIIVNKMTIDLSLDLKQADVEIKRMESGQECNCPECKKNREEDDGGL